MEKLEKKIETVEIEAWRYSIDWSYDKKHVINLAEVIGVNLYWRGEWHVEVVTRGKIEEYKNYSYELDHWVNENEIAKLIGERKLKVLRFINTHSSDNFSSEIKKVLDWSVKYSNLL